MFFCIKLQSPCIGGIKDTDKQKNKSVPKLRKKKLGFNKCLKLGWKKRRRNKRRRKRKQKQNLSSYGELI